MARRKYTDDQVQEALKFYADLGPAATAAQMGIPAPTIRKWAQRAGVTGPHAQKVAAATEAARAEFDKRREQLRAKMLVTVEDLLDRMQEPHQEFVGQHGSEVQYDRAPAQAVRSYATSIGILIDKMRLELGEHTSSNRQEDVSKLDREIDGLLSEFDRRDVSRANGNGQHASV